MDNIQDLLPSGTTSALADVAPAEAAPLVVAAAVPTGTRAKPSDTKTSDAIPADDAAHANASPNAATPVKAPSDPLNSKPEDQDAGRSKKLSFLKTDHESKPTDDGGSRRASSKQGQGSEESITKEPGTHVTHKHWLDDMQSITTASTDSWTSTRYTGILKVICYPIYMAQKTFRKALQYLRKNRDGVMGTICVLMAVIMTSFLSGSKKLTLTESYVYDFAFEDCMVGGQEALCPTHNLNHTMYFRYRGMYIDPYTENGVLLQEFIYFDYGFCKEIAIPTFPSNYQRHCNLLNAGIGTQVTMVFGLTLSCMALVHSCVILLGFSPWHAYHKFDWIFSLIAALCYSASGTIWHFSGHIDIYTERQMFSEVHAGMKVEMWHGFGFWMTVVAAGISFVGAYKLRWYIWMLEVELFKFKYEDSEKSSLSLNSADIKFLRGSDYSSETIQFKEV